MSDVPGPGTPLTSHEDETKRREAINDRNFVAKPIQSDEKFPIAYSAV
jgi:hypothetical protein